MQLIDDLINKMKQTSYEYIGYQGKKDTSPLLHSHDKSKELALRQLLHEFMQQNVIDTTIENQGLKQRIMILEACVNNSNFAPIIKPPRKPKPMLFKDTK